MSLQGLSDELILLVLSYTDIPELLSMSRFNSPWLTGSNHQTSHRLRALSNDPILHTRRLELASLRLSQCLPSRPSLSSLLPPASTIYLSKTHVMARTLARQLVSIRLARNLSRRPSASSLVNSNILPPECCRCDRATGEVVWGGGVAPSIVGVKRRVERERVKDGLRGWLERKAESVRTLEEKEQGDEERVGVRGLIRRFASAGRRAGAAGEQRWGNGSRKRGAHEPTRAHVYGLRRFWEGMSKGQDVGVGA